MGQCGVQLQPLVDALKQVMLKGPVLHADETPVAMLKPGNKKTHKAYIWTYCTTSYDAIKAVDFTSLKVVAASTCVTSWPWMIRDPRAGVASSSAMTLAVVKTDFSIRATDCEVTLSDRPRKEDVIKLNVAPRSIYAVRGGARWGW